jgi:hypothetical protein
MGTASTRSGGASVSACEIKTRSRRTFALLVISSATKRTMSTLRVARWCGGVALGMKQ